MKNLILLFGLLASSSFAAEVRVIEPAARSYSGQLSFIESAVRLGPHCIRVGDIVFRRAPFSIQTIRKMQARAKKMGADTLLIKDTTVGAVSYDYLIRMRAYKCKEKQTS